MQRLDYIDNIDCLEGMKLIPSGTVDMVLCDPPYACTRNQWDKEIPLDKLWSEYKRIIKENGAIVLFSSGLFTAKLMASNEKMWRYNLVWEKTTPTGFLNAKKMPLRCHEDIVVFYKRPPIYNPQMGTGPRKVATAAHRRNSKHGDSYGTYQNTSYDSELRYPRSVLHFKTDKQKCAYHPTQKPVSLLEYLIRTYTNPGDVVLDNCIGSGSTAVAAIKAGRHYIGFETDENYCRIAIKRINEQKDNGFSIFTN